MNYIFRLYLPMSTRQEIAAQNRQAFLDAAIHVFRLHGINAPLQLVIDQAQLGRATFYRNFQDRQALVLALMEQALQRLERKAEYYAQFNDGLIQLLENHVENLPYLTALMEYWRVIGRDDPRMIEIYQHRNAILQPLIDKAIKHNVCRADLTTQDYSMITAILRSSFQGLTETEQRHLASRAIDLLLNGIRI
ncbi:DNA-binding transcriptional repressor AcrR [Acinetobacter bouvetii]|uniref:DNA-binding transcriptional repressor AcrR n=2 Tax=Acinetobacter bouvetii TaxID=202951 RepID=A0A811GF64_9GAMM|nr:DNA-binding transcriptional repressor AcrR [Acinetobacter bouvetii]